MRSSANPKAGHKTLTMKQPDSWTLRFANDWLSPQP
jgi:hypothetical protein